MESTTRTPKCSMTSRISHHGHLGHLGHLGHDHDRTGDPPSVTENDRTAPGGSGQVRSWSCQRWFTEIPIDPAILAQEQAFWVKRNPLSQIAIRGASEDLEEADIEIEGEEEGVGGSRMDLCSSPPRSVASIDSIAENADF